jgi:hypothetical protein
MYLLMRKQETTEIMLKGIVMWSEMEQQWAKMNVSITTLLREKNKSSRAWNMTFSVVRKNYKRIR